MHDGSTLATKKKIKVTKEMLLCYQLQIIEDNSTFSGKNKKLIPNLGNKRIYKFHYQNLKLCLNLGLQLRKILRILEFKEEIF